MSVTRKESHKVKNVLDFNVSLSCVMDGDSGRFLCERCEKFFDCRDQRKWDIYKHGRFGLALEKMGNIKYKIAVIGGKGGVGKSMLAVNLASGLAMRGYSVAVLDSEYDGSSVPRMMGVAHEKLTIGKNGEIDPVIGPLGVKIVSIGNLMADNEIVSWYSDTRHNVTEEFITHVNYGNLDYLIVDLSPGTSADTINSMLFIPDMTGALFITVPSEVSQGVVLRAINLCLRGGIPALGIVENMSGYVCPECGERTEIYSTGGGDRLSGETGIPLIGRILIDGHVAIACDEGTPFVIRFPDCGASVAMNAIMDRVETEAGKVDRDLSHLKAKTQVRTWW